MNESLNELYDALMHAAQAIRKFQTLEAKQEKQKINTVTVPEKSVEYLTLRQLSERYPAFPLGTLRWMIFNHHKTGLDRICKRISRRILINPKEFENWVEEYNKDPKKFRKF